MSFSWRITPDDAFGPLAGAYAEQIEQGIVDLCERLTDEITDYMKENAPWTDRTGAARDSLYSVVQHEVRQAVSILLSHGSLIPYGVYLELSHGGRYAIIAPSVDWWGPRVFHEVQAMINRIIVP